MPPGSGNTMEQQTETATFSTPAPRIGKAKKDAPKANRTGTKRASARTAGKKSKRAPKAQAKKATGEPKGRKGEFIAMMKRAGGATLPEVMKKFGWQAHTIRGLVSVLGKTLKIERSKPEGGERTYKIAK
jgi:hypothetical protein